ncbi:MAG: ABC transporter transmembrane domain-containing protein, partial [Ardenticatenaceae bacterium]
MPFETYEEELQEIDERPFNREQFVRMMAYMRPYKREAAWMGVAILMATGVTLFEPYLFGLIVDRGIAPRDMRMVNTLVAGLLALHLLAWVGNLLRVRLMNTVGQGVLYDLRQQLFEHIQKLSLRFYDQRPVGRIMSRITSDVNSIAELINSGMVTIISQGIAIVGIIVVMFWLSWQLSLLAFFSIPALAIFFSMLRPRIETAWKNVRRT